MFNFIEKYLMKPMTKISQKRVVRAVAAAGMASIPFTIVGSMFLILTILPEAIPALLPLFEASVFKFTNLYMLAFKASMGLISMYFLISISYEYARIIQTEEKVNISPITAVMLSVFGLFICIPQLYVDGGIINLVHDPMNGLINGYAIGGGVSRLEASGLFTVILVSIITTKLYAWCVKKNLIIKLPDEVPEGVSRSFTALIPAFIIALFYIVLNGVLAYCGTDLYQIISVPFSFVANIADSYWGLLVIYFLMSALWIIGIHGAAIIGAFTTPIVLSNLAANMNGANYVFAGEFSNAFIYLGGSGATLGLTLMCAFWAKSEQLKILGKASIAPALFNINEPIIFGLPIVYNPIMAIPFFLAPMVSVSICYFAFHFGMVNPIVAQQPWPTPIGIGGFLATGGDWRGAVLALVSALGAALVYYPFFRVYDKKLYEAQMQGE